MSTEQTMVDLQSVVSTVLPLVGVQLQDVDPVDLPISGDPDDVEFFAFNLEDFCMQLDEGIDDWLKNRIDLTEFFNISPVPA